MGGAPSSSNQQQVVRPREYSNATKYNDRAGFARLPKEILYRCIPLSEDRKIRKKSEKERKIKSFTKSEAQASVLLRFDEVFDNQDNDLVKDTPLYEDNEEENNDPLPLGIVISLFSISSCSVLQCLKFFSILPFSFIYL